jgi:hypothetical protein
MTDHDTMTDRVEFRKWRDDGEIFALFPDSPADDIGNVTSYAHVGQHGAADYDQCIAKSVPASPDEFAPLQKELEKIGYTLTVVKPMTTVEADTMTEIKAGMIVRSFDFENRDLEGEHACYIDGTVTAILPVGHHLNPQPSCDAYQIHISRRIFGGKNIADNQLNVGVYVYPPVNGTRSILGGVTNGVVSITPVSE